MLLLLLALKTSTKLDWQNRKLIMLDMLPRLQRRRRRRRGGGVGAGGGVGVGGEEGVAHVAVALELGLFCYFSCYCYCCCCRIFNLLFQLQSLSMLFLLLLLFGHAPPFGAFPPLLGQLIKRLRINYLRSRAPHAALHLPRATQDGRLRIRHVAVG